eukprot:IDg5430t1
MAGYIESVVRKFDVCPRTGDPEPRKKLRVTKLEKKFITLVCFDIMYWIGKPILHIVDSATRYSETRLVGSREFLIIKAIEEIWNLRHGEPVEFVADQEFDKNPLSDWSAECSIKFSPLPARRHNKDGVVERKNRVMKDILERLYADKRQQ